jgi:uncharacterized protein DUF6599
VEERNEGRVFVRARRHYRPRYSRVEPLLGGAIAAGLALLAAWIAHRGAHPDPELMKSVTLERRAPERADRGALPKNLAPTGWREASISSFDPTNVYIKIDGREGYYKSFGFVRLDCATLAKTSTRGEETIDLELYDLGTPANALGAAAGELPESAAPRFEGETLVLLDRNALFLVRGHHYLRGIASSETAEIHRTLEDVAARVTAALRAAPLPGSYALFLGLGVAPSKVSYLPENAFSFGFARRVFVGLLPDGETELFVAVEKDAAGARALAARFEAGFAEHGRALGTRAGVRWSRDEWLARASAAGAVGRIVIGVHGATDEKSGEALFAQLEAAVRALPEDTDFAAPAPANEATE